MYKHFRLKFFLIGIAIGLCIVLFYRPPPQIIYEYPHPQNIKNRVYKDTNGICYKYNSQKVDCDANESTLKSYPIQS